MRSTFSGLEIAKSGLTLSQLGLDVTGHNIANVDTEGYTRQRIISTAYDPSAVVGRTKPVGRGLLGRGVQIKVLDQIRSNFLDKQYRTQNTSYSYYKARTENLTYLEAYFDDVQEETSLNYSISSFFEAIKTIGDANTDEAAHRKLLQESGEYLAQHLNDVYNNLINLQETQNLAVKTTVDEINTIAKQIADLNKSIQAFELNGQIANDLRDKRNLLLDELSTLTDIEYSEAESSVTVKIGGVELVNHVDVNELGVREVNNPIAGEAKVWEPYWVDTNTKFAGSGGELQAYIDVRDSTNSETPGIPYFIDMLNDLARAIAQEVNNVHKQGYTYPTDGGTSATGINFFGAVVNGNYTYNVSDITAKNICLSKEVAESPYNIACSSVAINKTGSGEDYQAGNNINMKALYELINKKDISVGGKSIGSLDGFTTSIRFSVAATLNNSKTLAQNRNTMRLAAENSRLSVSGVSLDEEMTNLIKYQHAYSGASRVITAMDEAIDKLINGTGRVGL